MTHLIDRLREASVDASLLPVSAIEDSAGAYLENLQVSEVVELARIAFKKPSPSGDDHFRSKIRLHVEQFPSRGEEQYVSVVAAHLLIRILDDVNDDNCILAATLVRTAQFQDWQPAHADVYGAAKAAWTRLSMNRFEQRERAVPSRRSSDVSKILNEYREAPNSDTTYRALLTFSKEFTQTRSYSNQLARRVESALAETQEQSGILWWLVSGWSLFGEKHFSHLDPDNLPILLATEMGSLVRRPPGPPASPAILRQAILIGKQEPDERTEVLDKESGEGMAEYVPAVWNQAVDFLPVLSWCRGQVLEIRSDYSKLDLAVETLAETMLNNLGLRMVEGQDGPQ